MDSRRAAAIACSVLGVICRVLGWGMCAITVLLCFSSLSTRLGLVGFVVDLSSVLPDIIAGYGLVPTPFGGVFRLDFAVVAVVLFLIDMVCMRAAARLRRMR